MLIGIYNSAAVSDTGYYPRHDTDEANAAELRLSKPNAFQISIRVTAVIGPLTISALISRLRAGGINTLHIHAHNGNPDVWQPFGEAIANNLFTLASIELNGFGGPVHPAFVRILHDLCSNSTVSELWLTDAPHVYLSPMAAMLAAREAPLRINFRFSVYLDSDQAAKLATMPPISEWRCLRALTIEWGPAFPTKWAELPRSAFRELQLEKLIFDCSQLSHLWSPEVDLVYGIGAFIARLAATASHLELIKLPAMVNLIDGMAAEAESLEQQRPRKDKPASLFPSLRFVWLNSHLLTPKCVTTVLNLAPHITELRVADRCTSVRGANTLVEALKSHRQLRIVRGITSMLPPNVKRKLWRLAEKNRHLVHLDHSHTDAKTQQQLTANRVRSVLACVSTRV